MESWVLSEKMNETVAAALGPATSATIMNETARFAPWLSEMRENEYAGSAVGGVVKVLLCLLAEDPKTASWDNAIDAASSHASRARGKVQMPVSKSSLRSYLNGFAPVMHLWCAWDMRGRHFLSAGPPEGLSFEDDFQMFPVRV